VTYLGHASVEYALALAETAGARRLAMFHHSPERTDNEIDDMVRNVRTSTVEVFAAAESTSLTLAAEQRAVVHLTP
jgi:phosphoribosyl 1,2-cyclic phosphodiesterase